MAFEFQKGVDRTTVLKFQLYDTFESLALEHSFILTKM